MSVSELSESAQNHLKVIWSLQEWSNEPVTTSTIAARAGLRQSTVSGAVSKLADRGLVEHEPYGAVRLTARGRRMALTMVRRHRLIETFLVSTLGYGWDEVHDEAERLEHAVSDLLVDRIDALLGHPGRDPHGDPIPDADGVVHLPDAILLTDADAGLWRVERISDEDPDLLRHFTAHGLDVGVELTVSAGPPYSGALEIRTAAGPPLSLGRPATDAVRVSGPHA